MAKVTSKLQLTLPKAIAEQFQIRPGDDLDWQPAGEAIRVSKRKPTAPEPATTQERLRLFDEASARQRRRDERHRKKKSGAHDRGWTREELYERGLSR